MTNHSDHSDHDFKTSLPIDIPPRSKLDPRSFLQWRDTSSPSSLECSGSKSSNTPNSNQNLEPFSSPFKKKAKLNRALNGIKTPKAKGQILREIDSNVFENENAGVFFMSPLNLNAHKKISARRRLIFPYNESDNIKLSNHNDVRTMIKWPKPSYHHLSVPTLQDVIVLSPLHKPNF